MCATDQYWAAIRALEFYGGYTAAGGPAAWGEAPLVYRLEQEDGMYYVRGYSELPKAGT